MTHPPNIRVVCGAKLKNGEGFCKRAAIAGRRRCAVHGGKTPRGLASPNTKHGRYSKDLPTRLAARYEQAVHDPDLLNLQDDIALIETRQATLLQAMNAPLSQTQRFQIEQHATNLKRALDANDEEGIRCAVQGIHVIAQEGDDYTTVLWNRLVRYMETKSKLVENERRRRRDMQNMMTAEEAMVLINQLVVTIKCEIMNLSIENSQKRQLLYNISQTFDRLTGASQAAKASYRDALPE